MRDILNKQTVEIVKKSEFVESLINFTMNYQSLGMSHIKKTDNRIPRWSKGYLNRYHLIYQITKEVSCICTKN